MRRHLNTGGFSLIELSIVLVILGLLVGGILAGRSLIHASELRSISADVNRYKAAIAAFRDKYFYLPGDMPNAVRVWGAQAGGTADGKDSTCAALDYGNPATGQATCNGDGNGQIGTYTQMSVNYENYRAWQQMANAGMIEGQYAGVTDSPLGTYSGYKVTAPGWNIPASKIAGAGYNLAWFGSSPDTAYTSLVPLNYGNVLIFGTPSINIIHNMSYFYAITPEDAWNVDTKMDDGMPTSGVVIAPATGGNANPNCATASALTATYKVTFTGIACGLIFKLGL